jgi:hypothetical protein
MLLSNERQACIDAYKGPTHPSQSTAMPGGTTATSTGSSAYQAQIRPSQAQIRPDYRAARHLQARVVPTLPSPANRYALPPATMDGNAAASLPSSWPPRRKPCTAAQEHHRRIAWG